VNPTKEAEQLSGYCISALKNITPEDRIEFADRIESAERIFVFGVGRSGLIGQTFAVRLVQLGLRVFFVGDMTTPIIGKNDLLILVSNTGNTMSVVKTAEIAKRIGTYVICVTSDHESDLTRTSDKILHIDTEYGPGPDAPLGTIFEDATLLFFDSMIPYLMDRLGVSEEDMRNRHAIWV